MVYVPVDLVLPDLTAAIEDKASVLLKPGRMTGCLYLGDCAMSWAVKGRRSRLVSH